MLGVFVGDRRKHNGLYTVKALLRGVVALEVHAR